MSNDLVEIRLIGDISLNGLFNDPQYFVELRGNLQDIFEGLGTADLTVANWESPLCGNGEMNPYKSPLVCTNYDAALSIYPMKLDVVTLANNHAYDCLNSGCEKTLHFLDQAGIRYVGMGKNKDEASKELYIERNGIKIGILNYLDPSINPKVPDNVNYFVNILDENKILQDVSQLATLVDIVLVSLHRGMDFVRLPSIKERNLARNIIDAGAKVVMCHHSHCVASVEKWNNGCILYGLGNFIFGGLKGWEARPWPKESRQTVIARCMLSKKSVESVDMCYFVQDGFILKADSSLVRYATQKRLNNKMILSDCLYNRALKREIFIQWMIKAPIRYILVSGGLLKALKRFKWAHIRLLIGNVIQK